MNALNPRWAWAPYQPNDQQPWSRALAAHLYRRAGFGANWPQLERALAEGPQRTIDRLMRPDAEVAAFHRACDELESPANSAEDLRAWWLRRMILTPHPFLERMTLFWHHHFATSNLGVQNGHLMRDQLQRLRAEALGSYRTLLKTMSLDPAVMLWLGGAANRQALPSTAFAHAFMEHYVLGPAQFSETDAKAVARAYTGWFVIQGQLRYLEREHDSGTKEILGRRGQFEVPQVVALWLEQPAAAQWVVRHLYRQFISEMEEPEAALLEPLVAFFQSDYQVLPLVERMLRSNLFFSPAAYRRRIKSPAEFALGLILGLEGRPGTVQLGADLAGLGQDLYHPPTPRGWAGGQHWINQATLAGRGRLAGALLRSDGPYAGVLDPAKLARKYHRPPQEFLVELFLPGSLAKASSSNLGSSQGPLAGGNDDEARDWTRTVTSWPEFQLA